ncbi:MAG: M23 family metallopeptidase [Deltaproteobacteria bacterium]|nr:M23 family metallopeptidase [Deltaproteobacteria bacterium]
MSKHLLRTQVSCGGRRVAIKGVVHLGLLFALLIGINLYVFFFRDGSSVGDLLNAGARMKKASSTKPVKTALPGAESKTSRAVASTTTDFKTVIKGSLRGHNGLYQALDASKVKAGDIAGIVATLRGEVDLRTLRPRHHFEIHLKGGQVSHFTFHLSRRVRIEVEKAGKGKFVAKRVQRPVVTHQAAIGLRVQSSLEQDFRGIKESVAVLYRVLQLFSWDINWTTDVRKGDTLRLIVEKQFLDGQMIGYGRVLAAEYQGKRVGAVRGFHHRTETGDEGYYSPAGRSLKRKLLKVPLNFRRMSSGFDRRRLHPILHKVKAHLGVDYAAPTGTPIWAAGDGVVTWAKWAGPAGKMVKIRHEGVTSVYLHLSRIARGLRAGMKVKQRQVIGYVGTTGRSTGPHLHYGLQVRGRYVDPLSYPVPRGVLLSRGERERFLPLVARRVLELEAIPLAEGKQSKPHAKPRTSAPKEEDIWS